jgi:hypothetical protein
MLTLKDPAPLPDAGETVSHDASAEADHVPDPPVKLTVTVCAPECKAPLFVAPNVRPDRLTATRVLGPGPVGGGPPGEGGVGLGPGAAGLGGGAGFGSVGVGLGAGLPLAIVTVTLALFAFAFVRALWTNTARR